MFARGSTGGTSSPGEAAPAALAADWETLHQRFGRVVYAVPRRFGLSGADCDDVYQSTWLTAVTRPSPPVAQGDGVMVRWLAAIAAWETRNLLRRRRATVREPGLLEAVEADPEGMPERLELLVEQHRLVEESLAALPERDRSLLRDLFLCDEPLSYEQVAARFGVSVGSVGPLRLRAIERLRAELSRRGF
jgi:RNA polymerase sigma factor (sigma-70 family)